MYLLVLKKAYSPTKSSQLAFQFIFFFCSFIFILLHIFLFSIVKSIYTIKTQFLFLIVEIKTIFIIEYIIKNKMSKNYPFVTVNDLLTHYSFHIAQPMILVYSIIIKYQYSNNIQNV